LAGDEQPVAKASPAGRESVLKMWYVRCGTPYASEAMDATTIIDLERVITAPTRSTARARFNPPTSRTRCSLKGPSPRTQCLPNPGKSSKNDRGANCAHTPITIETRLR
jgi:hypothetical protein